MDVTELSYDPQDPFFSIPGDDRGMAWGVQIFTTGNLYGLAPEHTEVVAEGDGLRVSCNRLSWGGQQGRSEGQVEAVVSVRGRSVTLRISAWHDEPVKAIKLLLRNLPTEVQREGLWHPTLPQGESLWPRSGSPVLWRYPGPEWLTPWACIGEAQGAISISVRDPEVRAKRLYAHVPPYLHLPEVEVICEESALRWCSHFTSPEIKISFLSGLADLEADFRAHLEFLEGSYGLRRWEDRQDVPGWARDIKLVVYLHGQHWTGHVFNTFDKMAYVLEQLTRLIAGRHVLCFVPGWSGRYYFSYPLYAPGESLGGSGAFERFISVAHRLGVKVMPMFGATGANARLYPGWERAAFLNRTGRVVKLINAPDWDTDRHEEDDQVFLNPGEPSFRQHLIEEIRRTVARYGVDAVFLDASSAWFNDPRYDVYAGYRELVASLRERFPHILIAGEGWYDALLALLPMNQSLLGVSVRYRLPELLTRYARVFGHMAQGAPASTWPHGTGSTGVYEEGFLPVRHEQPEFGHILSVNVVEDTLDRYWEEMATICRMALRSA
ncbi:hypothetical protein Tter_2520 [Thermobaculum terrenum ATCC BAA-798]|uniref:Uncharacterized protein n=1 Tax=Thermobaculum terrenum (strain ATCC BAA-798 / CCMEE 7001 / YNP1) TaxID=525904 RepID=D1CI38_THET1|nr:hypothetical protein [Thermobaculum terrenum]ACZ43409.1 hypothetical protein Tter_2520 [Thermobaculum terrenum ATCC BAA-798]